MFHHHLLCSCLVAAVILIRLKLLYKPMPWDAEPGRDVKENIARKKR